jgi:hypothetical protein
MGSLAITFSVDILISAICMWLATKFSFVKAEFNLLLIMIALVSIVSLIPAVGWVLGLLLFVFLMMKFSGCSAVDAIWVVLFTKLFSFVVILGLLHLF